MATQSEMSFWDHLEALRWMLVRIFIALGVFMLLGFMFIPYLFDHVVMAPSRGDFFLYRWIAETGQSLSFVPDFMGKPFRVDVISHCADTMANESASVCAFKGAVAASRRRQMLINVFWVIDGLCCLVID